MKIKNLLYLFVFILSGQFFSSCNSAKPYTFSGTTGTYHASKVPVQKLAPEDRYARPNEFAPQENPVYASTENTIPEARPMINLADAEPAAVTETTEEMTTAEKKSAIEEKITRKLEKKLQNATPKSNLKQVPAGLLASVPLLAKVIIALFIPPLAVFLHSGIGTPFWISLILTLLFFLPGVIYALLVVTDTI